MPRPFFKSDTLNLSIKKCSDCELNLISTKRNVTLPVRSTKDLWHWIFLIGQKFRNEIAKCVILIIPEPQNVRHLRCWNAPNLCWARWRWSRTGLLTDTFGRSSSLASNQRARALIVFIIRISIRIIILQSETLIFTYERNVNPVNHVYSSWISLENMPDWWKSK